MAAFDVQHAVWDGVPFGMNGAIKVEWVLVRHGESLSNRRLMCEGEPVRGAETGLTETGRAQAALTQAVLKDMLGPATTVWVSPLRRARDTLGDDIAATIVNGLREVERGTEPRFAERVERVREKIRAAAVAAAVDGPPRRRIIVVGHSQWIDECLRQLIGVAGKSTFHLGNAAISILHETEWGIEIQMTGDVSHLPRGIRTGHHTALHYR